MSKVKVKSNIPIEPKEALQKVKDLMVNDSLMKKWDPHYQYEIQENQVHIKGKHLNASITVWPCEEKPHPDVPNQVFSTIQIEVDLPLMLSPFKTLVKTKLEKMLAQTFPANPVQ